MANFTPSIRDVFLRVIIPNTLYITDISSVDGEYEHFPGQYKLWTLFYLLFLCVVYFSGLG